ncbi:putative serine/threonine-protein kinase haspin homolog isoform X2 [Drosophila novamexicana]|uniref:putative serine/threonine-protein kinase haspin homolog isoform X2 n=1 Tax=Drosophila novamexicana TaxID=47314 RepID=UPI0011E5FD0E|nr:putative serine/threonine-protein kinase haspin homolog isoform X2 [Drosophila novamexicana]
MDSTLPDDAWKDSFDRLLDPRPQLRERNIIKKNVRASFNIDSSVENSNPNLLSFTEYSSQKPQAIDTADKLDIKKRGNSISTPSEKRLSSNLFHCALSPITGLKLDGLQNADNHQLKGTEKKQTRRTAKQVIFEVNTLSPEKSSDSIVENKRLRLMLPNNGFRQSRSSLVLQPGKWRKSLISWRRTNLNEVPPGVLSPKPSFIPRAVTSEGLVACHIAQRTSAHLNEISEPNKKINYETEVLKYCAQSKPYKFSTAYASGKMIDPCKIGEGVYGEVFKYAQKNSTRTDIVMKVLPIEGTALVNEEIQKTFEQILPEIIISQELSKLRTNKTNSTSGFVDIYNVRVYA